MPTWKRLKEAALAGEAAKASLEAGEADKADAAAEEQAERKRAEEAERKQKEEADRARQEEEAERKGKEEAERARREQEEAERKQTEEAELARQQEEEAERKQKEEAERARREQEEAERKRQEEAERARREQEEAERRRQEEEAEAERRRREDAQRAREEEEHRLRQEAERARREQEEEAERRRREEEEEAARRRQEELEAAAPLGCKRPPPVQPPEATAAAGEEPPSPGSLPLVLATKAGDLQKVMRLLEEGVDPNVEDAMGETPIFKAAERHFADIVAVLLLHGADSKWENKAFTTPPEYADVETENLMFLYQGEPVDDDDKAASLQVLSPGIRQLFVDGLQRKAAEASDAAPEVSAAVVVEEQERAGTPDQEALDLEDRAGWRRAVEASAAAKEERGQDAVLWAEQDADKGLAPEEEERETAVPEEDEATEKEEAKQEEEDRAEAGEEAEEEAKDETKGFVKEQEKDKDKDDEKGEQQNDEEVHDEYQQEAMEEMEVKGEQQQDEVKEAMQQEVNEEPEEVKEEHEDVKEEQQEVKEEVKQETEKEEQEEHKAEEAAREAPAEEGGEGAENEVESVEEEEVLDHTGPDEDNQGRLEEDSKVAEMEARSRIAAEEAALKAREEESTRKASAAQAKAIDEIYALASVAWFGSVDGFSSECSQGGLNGRSLENLGVRMTDAFLRKFSSTFVTRLQQGKLPFTEEALRKRQAVEEESDPHRSEHGPERSLGKARPSGATPAAEEGAAEESRDASAPREETEVFSKRFPAEASHPAGRRRFPQTWEESMRPPSEPHAAAPPSGGQAAVEAKTAEPERADEKGAERSGRRTSTREALGSPEQTVEGEIETKGLNDAECKARRDAERGRQQCEAAEGTAMPPKEEGLGVAPPVAVAPPDLHAELQKDLADSIWDWSDEAVKTVTATLHLRRDGQVSASDCSRSSSWFASSSSSSSWRLDVAGAPRLILVMGGSQRVMRLSENGAQSAVLEGAEREPPPTMNRWPEAEFRLLVTGAVDSTARVTVGLPFDATFADAKAALAAETGIKEILATGRLVRPKGQAGLYANCKDASFVGAVRHVFLLGADLRSARG